MAVDFEIQIENQARAKLAQAVIDFVVATASYSTGYTNEGYIFNTFYPALSQEIERHGITKIILKDFVREGGIKTSTPGGVGLLESDTTGSTAVILLNFDIMWPKLIAGNGFPVGANSLEEILFHELSHIALGHLETPGLIGNPGIENAAMDITNDSFRDELDLLPRSVYQVQLPQLRSGSEILSNQCFPSGTPITLADGTTKPIEDITTTDQILTHTTNGTPVAGIVDKLFTNTTTAFIRLTFTDSRDDLITTPGHRFLTETGDYMEIGHMLRLGGGTVRVVEQDGTVITATGEVLEYSAETADMLPVTATKTIAFEGNAVLKQDVQEGWTTYNFEVREHHTHLLRAG